jgi:hypothetical protein
VKVAWCSRCNRTPELVHDPGDLSTLNLQSRYRFVLHSANGFRCPGSTVEVFVAGWRHGLLESPTGVQGVSIATGVSPRQQLRHEVL